MSKQKRTYLYELLQEVQANHLTMFRKMYLGIDKNASIKQIVFDELKDIQLDHAISQVENTIKKIHDGVLKNKDYFFDELLDYLKLKTDVVKYPGNLFYFRDNKLYLYYDVTGNTFYFNRKIDNVLCDKYEMGLLDSKEYIKKKIDTKYYSNGNGCDKIIPIFKTDSFVKEVENYFNNQK